MAYKMKGFSGFGNGSPLKKGLSLSQSTPSSDKRVSINAPMKPSLSRPKKTSTLQDFGKDVSNITNFLTKKHNLYKNKNLTLKGQVDAPKVNLGWKGGPTLDLKTSANLSGKYKLGKSTTLSGGVDFRSKQKPYYTAGLNIRI